MEQRSHFDFVTSIVLMLLSIAVLIDSYRIGVDAGGPMYTSPGMLPMVLAILLLLTSFRLFRRSVRANGFAGNAREFSAWLRGFVTSPLAREMLVGGLALATYTFGLAPRMPFWASTSIFLIGLMLLLKAASLVRSILIAAAVVGSIYGVFQMIFHVPLP